MLKILSLLLGSELVNKLLAMAGQDGNGSQLEKAEETFLIFFFLFALEKGSFSLRGGSSIYVIMECVAVKCMAFKQFHLR